MRDIGICEYFLSFVLDTASNSSSEQSKAPCGWTSLALLEIFPYLSCPTSYSYHEIVGKCGGIQSVSPFQHMS